MRYRSVPYSLQNSVAPRFEAVDPKSEHWASEGPREAVGIPLAPYLEVRAVAKEPKLLPRDVLFRDYIRGSGAQQFVVKAPPGDYEVIFLHPDRTTRTAAARSDGMLRITFPEGEWSVSGLVIKGAQSRQLPPAWTPPKPLARPAIFHEAPAAAVAGEPLGLRLSVTPASHVSSVRLHYRPVNQLAKFKTVEGKPGAAFQIPAEDVSAGWDLMYYFEVLNDHKGGWFQPDPAVATPYYVVKVNSNAEGQ